MLKSERFSAAAELIPIWIWLGVLSAYYAFVTSAGTFDALSWHTDYYDLLAKGIADGHTYLPIKPSARLLRKANPYDFKYWRMWLWDVSLFDGHYYLYWGPVPSLCLLIFKTLTRWRDTINDQWLVLAFMLGRLYAGAALIVSFARAPGMKVPSWALQLAVLVFALAIPSPYFMARPLVYEASIAAGQFFLLLGLYSAFRGLDSQRGRLPRFVLAGTCFSLAFGSRGSLLVVAPLLTVSIAVIASRPGGYRLRSLAANALALGTPVALGIASYAYYNHARFGSYTEFGLKYQLTSRPFGTSDAFFLPNVVSYLTSTVKWSCHFPFATLPMHRTLPTWISWPEEYDVGDWDKGERTAGLVRAMTVCLLWGVWVVRAAIVARRRIAHTPLSRTSMTAAFNQRELFLVTCACCCMCALLPASRMWMANMRFLQDAAAGIQLGAIGAAFWLVRPHARAVEPRSRLRRAGGSLLFAGLGLHTIVVGVLLGFTGHMNNFEEENPDLYHRLEKKLSVCRPKNKKSKHADVIKVIRQVLHMPDFSVAWRDAQR